MLVTSRAFAEYEAFFDPTSADLVRTRRVPYELQRGADRVLSVVRGPASMSA